MRKNDPELERLRSEKEAAQREIDSIKAQLDRISPQRNAYRDQIQSINATITDLKQRINSERDAIGICKAARDRISADTHRYNLQSYKAALQEQYSAVNKAYRQVVDDLEPTFKETAHYLQELISLRDEEVEPEVCVSGEEGRRTAALRAARRQAHLQRERELVVRLKELREVFESANEQMAHWLYQANAIVRMRLSCYWDGILKSSGSEVLPPFPILEEQEVPGQKSFQQRVGSVLTQISEGLSACEKEDCNA